MKGILFDPHREGCFNKKCFVTGSNFYSGHAMWESVFKYVNTAKNTAGRFTNKGHTILVPVELID